MKNFFNLGEDPVATATTTVAEPVATQPTQANYLTAVQDLTCLDIPVSAVKGQTRSVILHNFTLSRGRVTAIFQLPDYQTENEWFRFKEARTVNGVQNTADLQMEFVKFAYSTALENLSHTSPKWTKTRDLLKRKGFEDSYFETTYKSDPMINKLYYIIRDAGLLEEFRAESYDFNKFRGRELQVAWSTNGNLMSPKGEENKTTRASIPASDSVMSSADYNSTKEEFDL
tara:strand:- start:153 stop:839 length:687 start_codon:yes stop_codon:yes gene_type:complete